MFYIGYEKSAIFVSYKSTYLHTQNPRFLLQKGDGIFHCHIPSTQKIWNELSRNVRLFYSTRPYFTLIRSSFSSIGSAAIRRKITVAAA